MDDPQKMALHKVAELFKAWFESRAAQTTAIPTVEALHDEIRGSPAAEIARKTSAELDRDVADAANPELLEQVTLHG